MQKFLRKSRKWSALLIGMVVMTLLTVLVIGFLEKAMRLGKNIGGIERSVQAYYFAGGEIEKKLQDLGPDLKKQPWVMQSGSRDINHFSSVSVDVATTSDIIPKVWLWNSPFDSNYNIISLDRPVQIVIPDGIDWGGVSVDWKLPTIGNIAPTYSMALNNVILWSLGNTAENLSAKPEWTDNGFFHGVEIAWDEKSFWNKVWIFYDQSTGVKQEKNLSDFYRDKLEDTCVNFACTLKFSMLKPMEKSDGTKMPFLEYRLKFNKTIPLQFMTLDATGYVGDYARKRSVQIPQITTNTALDFAVLQ